VRLDARMDFALGLMSAGRVVGLVGGGFSFEDCAAVGRGFQHGVHRGARRARKENPGSLSMIGTFGFGPLSGGVQRIHRRDLPRRMGRFS
jgi:hypothetical protein